MPTVVPSLRALARSAVPQALEAAVVPAGLYLVASYVVGPRVAMLAPLAWALSAVSRRAVRGRRVSGMMVLALVTFIARSLIAFAADSTFLYFVQPTIGGLALACAFLVSVVVDRPLLQRFAGDFCELPATVLARPAVHRCFRHLSLLWGGYGLANAALGVWMLTAQPTAAYVVLRTASSILGTAVMVAVSVTWFRRVLEHDAVPAGAGAVGSPPW